MNVQYAEAFTEIDMILNIMPKDIIDKIPLSFRNLISDKKSKTYKSSAIDDIFITEELLKNETKNILSVIYRKYLCEPEMRGTLEIDDNNELKRLEKELNQKYSYDNLFKNRSFNIENIENLPQIKDESLFTKILNKIKSIFKIK